MIVWYLVCHPFRNFFTMTPCQKADSIMLFRWCASFSIYTVVSAFQMAHVDVVVPGYSYSNPGTRNISIDGIAISYGNHFPEDGLVVSLIGSRPDASEGCVPSLAKFVQSSNSMSTSDNASLQTLLPIFTESFALLLHRTKCHLRDTIRAADTAGYAAVLVYDHAYVDLASIAIFDGLFTNVSLATFFLSFVDGRLLWRKCQYLSGCYVVISPSSGNINSSILLPTYIASRDGIPLNTSSSDIANVLLGFIPAVSYVCIVLSVLLIIIARRFFHCSLFVVYKIVMNHHPSKVAPGCAGSGVENSENGDPTRCSICLDDIKSTDRIHSILPCHHVFHQVCIELWLRKGKLVCPLCRRKITLGRILNHVFHDGKPNGPPIYIIPSCRPILPRPNTVHPFPP